MRGFLRYGLTSIYILTSIFLHAQRLAVTSYLDHPGVSFTGANYLFQDSGGWIWFTTGYEVIRYDGDEFKRFVPRKGSGMLFCHRILEIGNEIIIQANPTLLKVVGDSLETLTHADEWPDIISQIKHRDKDYFLCADGLYIFVNDKFQRLIPVEGTKFLRGEQLFAMNDTTLITYSWRTHLLTFNLSSLSSASMMMPVSDLGQDAGGNMIMLLKDAGIYGINTAGSLAGHHIDTTLIYRIEDPKAEIFQTDDKGNIWIGVQEKYLLKLSSDLKAIRYDESDGLPGLWFYDFLRDREGNVWMGFNIGLAKIQQTPYTRYTREDGLLSNHIRFLLPSTTPEDIWACTYNGLVRVNASGITTVLNNGIPFQCQQMLVNDEQFFYVADQHLFRADLDPAENSLSNNRKLAVINGTPQDMEEAGEGTLFIATDKGLMAWNGKELISFPEINQHYTCLLAHGDDHLWAGTFAGPIELIRIHDDDGNLSLYRVEDKLLEGNTGLQMIRSVAGNTFGQIFVGTRYNGFFVIDYHEGKIHAIKAYDTEDGMNSNSVWGVSANPEGDAWIATSHGLNRWQRNSGAIEDISALAGIRQAAGVLSTDNHTIWIASHPGVVLLDPSPAMHSNFVTTINNILIDGRSVPVNEGVSWRLKAKQSIAIHFSANTYLDEATVQYTYQLRHHQSGDWSQPAAIHNVTYPSLSPGKYIFSVKARNQFGIWSQHEATISFVVAPPVWKRPWFLTLSGAFLLSVIYFLHRFRLKQLIRLHQMREHISKDLHDDIGSSLTNIQILNTLAQTHLREPVRAKEYLIQAGDDIQQISESLSDIVWNINPNNDDLHQLLSRMKRFAADMLEGQQLAVELHFPDGSLDMELPLQKRRDFYLIFKEAIHNVIKHSGAKHVRIEIKELEHSISMTIRDDGTGFIQNGSKDGNGLRNMQLRALQSDAKLSISTEIGMGTTVHLVMRS